MPPKASSSKSRSASKKAAERKEKKLLEEKINQSKEKCEEAVRYMQPEGKRADPDFAKAKECLEEAIALYGSLAQPFYLMGQCCRCQNELSEAVNNYSKALDAEATNLLALEGRALCYHGLHDVPRAIEDYSSMITIDPENDYAYCMRAMCIASTRVPGLRLKAADFKRCESDLKTAIRLNEANYYAMSNLGKVYEDQGELEQAITFYSESLNAMESYTYARFRRGCTKVRLAEDTLRVANGPCYDADAVAMDSARAREQNVADIEKEAFDKLQKENSREIAKRTLDGAIEDFTALLDSDPEADKNLADVSVVLNLGVCAMLLDDLDRADAYFGQANDILAARPQLVEAGEATPIEDSSAIQKVLDLRKAELRAKKLERAEANSS